MSVPLRTLRTLHTLRSIHPPQSAPQFASQFKPLLRASTRAHAHARTIASMASSRIQNPALFICDMQEKFRPAINEYPAAIATAQKLLRAAHVLGIPVYVTTQNRARLGATVSELDVSGAVVDCDKTRFSMLVPPLLAALESAPAAAKEPPKRAVAIVGIEAHICVTQTALDLLAAGHGVYVMADGVSSCNAQEVPVALARLRAAGAVVTTSESWLYELLGDAGVAEFKQIAALVKETKEATAKSLQSLL